MRNYFGDEGYFNVGYWNEQEKSPASASRALTDRMVAHVPPDASLIADIGCGLGATTRRISELRPDARVLAVNFSFSQLNSCRINCPAAQPLQMDAACLGLRSSSLDAIISVEAAFHFFTRVDFLRECARTLRPGGVLSVADALFAPEGWPGGFTVPEENFLAGSEAYRELLLAAGFEDISIESATDKCWGGFCRGLVDWAQSNSSFNEPQREFWRDHAVQLQKGIMDYLLISARKPTR